MNIENLTDIEQMSDFLSGSQAIAFVVASTKDERYQLVERVLKRFNYHRLKRCEKGVVIQFLMKISGYSRQQITRMIERYKSNGYLQRQQSTIKGFERIYTAKDIRLLAELDKRHDTPNGGRVKKLCERAYSIFREEDYQRLSKISVSHIYNLRQSTGYQRMRVHYEKTKPTKKCCVGERRKPAPNGKPGYIRIDTVHQGDFDGVKGVYHINAVDEVTQFEVVVSVEKISEQFLLPALAILLEAFPFKILNFHSDNGSEYINYQVARLLNKCSGSIKTDTFLKVFHFYQFFKIISPKKLTFHFSPALSPRGSLDWTLMLPVVLTCSSVVNCLLRANSYLLK